MSKQLGIDLPALVGALDGPVIAYVRAGLPLPEVTIAAEPSQPQRAVKAIGQLITKFAQAAARGADEGRRRDANKVDLGALALYYGVNGGELVVTDSANALAELKGSVGHLTGDGVFKEAKDGAGMPDERAGLPVRRHEGRAPGDLGHRAAREPEPAAERGGEPEAAAVGCSSSGRATATCSRSSRT